MAARDDFEGPVLTGPGYNFFAVTPSDSLDLPDATRGVWVGGAGTLVVDSLFGDQAVSFVGVQAGTLLPIRVRRVRATNTTATSIVGIY